MGYNHLSFEERIVIQEMLHFGLKQKQIAWRLNRSPSTISREISRNGFTYRAKAAHIRYEKIIHRERPKKLENSESFSSVFQKLKAGWSPEQISGRLRLYQNDYQVSPETIYRFIYRLKGKGMDLTGLLRRSHKRRRRRSRIGPVSKAKRLRSIHRRPAVIDQRKRLGDWEADTIHGSKKSGFIATFVDRKSLYCLAAKLKRNTAEAFTCAARDLFAEIENDQLYSITADNGSEMSNFEELEEILQCKLYFADPGAPWQRGLNENTNGLLRQYFPKKASFSKVRQKDVRRAVEHLNHRPRKSLGYKTPHEVFHQIALLI